MQLNKRVITISLFETKHVGRAKLAIKHEWRLILFVSKGSQIILYFFSDSIRNNLLHFECSIV